MAPKRSKVAQVTEGKITIPMGDYDPSKDAGYAGEPPRKGIYTFKLTEVRFHNSSAGNSSIYWRFRIEDTTSPYHGWPYGDQYTNLEATLWKTQQILFALTGTTEDADLDLSDTKAGEKSRAKFVEAARLVRANVIIEAGNDEYEDRPRMGKVMPYDELAQKRAAKAATVEADEDDDLDEDEDDFEDAETYEDDDDGDDDEDEEDDEEEDDEDEDEDDTDDDEDDEEDEDDDEEDEPEPEPVKATKRVRRPVGGSTSTKAPAKATKATAEPVKKAGKPAAKPATRSARRTRTK